MAHCQETFKLSEMAQEVTNVNYICTEPQKFVRNPRRDTEPKLYEATLFLLRLFRKQQSPILYFFYKKIQGFIETANYVIPK